MRTQVGDEGPLGGIVVADFTRVLAGPYATMMLGDLGAEVIKVEQPRLGDETRSWGPPFDAGTSTYFLAVNRNKRSLTLDLRAADGQALADRLVRRADVVIENFRPGTMDRLGLGPQHVRAVNPRAVYCSISGFGDGEGAALPGYDLLVQAVGGLMSITGAEDGAPAKVGVALVDVLAGLHAALGILAALRGREITGEGQEVRTSLLSSLLSALVNQASGYLLAGVVPRRVGNAHPSIAPYQCFEAGDRSVVVAVGNDRQFAALCGALGLGELVEDERFGSNTGRVEHRDELAARLGASFAERRAAEWVLLLTEAGVPCGLVNDVAEAFDLATALGLEPIVQLSAPGGNPPLTVANPITLSRTPVSYRRAAPRLGEHSSELAAWLAEHGEGAAT